MADRVVWFNGRFVAERDARVSIYDSALTLGDMAFEVTRTVNGRPYRLGEHLERLAHSLRVLRIDPQLSRSEFEAMTRETLARNLPLAPPEVDWTIIHDVSRGPAPAFAAAFDAADRRPTVVVSCFPLAARQAAMVPAYESGMDLVVPQQRSFPAELLDPSIKTRSRVHYQLASLQAHEKRPGAAALLLDPDGYVTEGASGNVFFVKNGDLLTPCARNLLPGITRGVVLGLAGKLGLRASEADIDLSTAMAANEAFMTATSLGIVHVRTLEGVTIGDGRAGPLTVRLRLALHEHAGLDFVAQARLYAARPDLRSLG